MGMVGGMERIRGMERNIIRIRCSSMKLNLLAQQENRSPFKMSDVTLGSGLITRK